MWCQPLGCVGIEFGGLAVWLLVCVAKQSCEEWLLVDEQGLIVCRGRLTRNATLDFSLGTRDGERPRRRALWHERVRGRDCQVCAKIIFAGQTAVRGARGSLG